MSNLSLVKKNKLIIPNQHLDLLNQEYQKLFTSTYLKLNLNQKLWCSDVTRIDHSIIVNEEKTTEEERNECKIFDFAKRYSDPELEGKVIPQNFEDPNQELKTIHIKDWKIELGDYIPYFQDENMMYENEEKKGSKFQISRSLIYIISVILLLLVILNQIAYNSSLK